MLLDMQSPLQRASDRPKPRQIIKGRADHPVKQMVKMPLKDHGAERLVRSHTPYIRRASIEQPEDADTQVSQGDVWNKRGMGQGQDARGKMIVYLFYHR